MKSGESLLVGETIGTERDILLYDDQSRMRMNMFIIHKLIKITITSTMNELEDNSKNSNLKSGECDLR